MSVYRNHAAGPHLTVKLYSYDFFFVSWAQIHYSREEKIAGGDFFPTTSWGYSGGFETWFPARGLGWFRKPNSTATWSVRSHFTTDLNSGLTKLWESYFWEKVPILHMLEGKRRAFCVLCQGTSSIACSRPSLAGPSLSPMQKTYEPSALLTLLTIPKSRGQSKSNTI